MKQNSTFSYLQTLANTLNSYDLTALPAAAAAAARTLSSSPSAAAEIDARGQSAVAARDACAAALATDADKAAAAAAAWRDFDGLKNGVSAWSKAASERVSDVEAEDLWSRESVKEDEEHEEEIKVSLFSCSKRFYI